MIGRNSACLVLVFLAVSAHAEEQEEAVVRSTYAKLHYAADLETVRAYVDGPDFNRTSQLGSAGVPASVLSIKITDLSVGNFSEIQNRLLSDLTPPPDSALAIALANHRYHDGGDGKETWIRSLQLNWAPPQITNSDWRMPVQDAVTIDEPGKRYSRFAHYTVKLIFFDKSVTYRSLFLFEPGSDGKRGVRILDPVISVTALMAMLTYDPYPGAFVEGPHKSTRVVRDWLQRKEGLCGYDAGHGVCCDLTALNCRMADSNHANSINSFLRVTENYKRRMREVADEREGEVLETYMNVARDVYRNHPFYERA